MVLQKNFKNPLENLYGRARLDRSPVFPYTIIIEDKIAGAMKVQCGAADAA